MSTTYLRRPRKALGQHWLVDSRYLSRIVSAADIGPDETVIEVGAGNGALTAPLARQAARLVAVEIDERLAQRLQERFVSQPHVTVVSADVLNLTAQDLLARGGAAPPYVVVGNLPFFIGTAVVRHFLRSEPPPPRLVVTVQAEVAESMAAERGRMTYLSVEVQLFARARLAFFIPPRAFRPPPKVRSAVVRLDVLPSPAVAVDDPDTFLRFVQAGFAAPRKQLRNSLAIGLGEEAGAVESVLAGAGIERSRRPQTLSLEEWAALYRSYRQTAEGLRQ
ncbi:MAG: ribosomal RNA small subunit methyltransferase A [Chloroflexi bacterium]|nr:ribosomal RNA small subunit methyltransferase A [Chloroflexota bacterium]